MITGGHEFTDSALARARFRNLKLAVESSSILDSVVSMIEKASLDRCFELMLSHEDLSKAKPNPRMYITAENRLEVMPERPQTPRAVQDTHRRISPAARRPQVLAYSCRQARRFSNLLIAAARAPGRS